MGSGNEHAAIQRAAMDDAPNCIRILLVHKHRLFRDALRCLIDACPDLRVMGEAAGSSDALTLARSVRPHVVLLDLPLDDSATLALIPALTLLEHNPRLLLLTSINQGEPLRLAIRLGAAGVLHKAESGAVLCKALRCVHRGELWLDRSMTALVLQEFRQQHHPDHQTTKPNGSSSLSRREREIVALVAHGLGTRKLAEQLHISDKTVRNHLASIYDKLKVSDRVELALYAIKHGLNQPAP